MKRLGAGHPLPRRCAVAAVVAAMGGCGAETTRTEESVDHHPRDTQDAGARTGAGGAPEAGHAEGSGGVLFHFDASPRPAAGGAAAPPLDETGRARCKELSA